MNSAYAGGYKYDYTGKPSLNTDYITEYKAETKNGVQTVTFKINPKAKFNDGTPIDIESVRAAHKIFTAPAGEYQVTDAPMWKQVKSVEENGDKFSVKVTMEKPYYPIDGDSLFPPLFTRRWWIRSSLMTGSLTSLSISTGQGLLRLKTGTLLRSP